MATKDKEALINDALTALDGLEYIFLQETKNDPEEIKAQYFFPLFFREFTSHLPYESFWNLDKVNFIIRQYKENGWRYVNYGDTCRLRIAKDKVPSNLKETFLKAARLIIINGIETNGCVNFFLDIGCEIDYFWHFHGDMISILNIKPYVKVHKYIKRLEYLIDKYESKDSIEFYNKKWQENNKESIKF